MLKQALEKQLNILDYTLGSLWQRRFKNLAVLLIFAAVIFLLASFQMTTRALTNTAGEVLAHAPEITVQHLTAGRQESLPLEYLEHLGDIFGIRAVVPRIWGYYFNEATGANYTVLALQTGRMPLAERLDLTLAEGSFPEPAEQAEVVIGPGVLDDLQLDGRRVFSLYRPDLSLKPFGISGIFTADTGLLTEDLLVMQPADARDLFGIPADRVTDLCVYVANPSEIDTISRKIADRLPDARVLTRPQIAKTYEVVFGWRSGFASICLLTALAAFAILSWDKASGLSPEERREIAILKILGWETSDVLTARFWESLSVSFLAFVLGCTAAYLHVACYDAGLLKPVMAGWSVIRPTLSLVPAVRFDDLLLVCAFTVLPYLAATVIPAWRAAAVSPDSVLH